MINKTTNTVFILSHIVYECMYIYVQVYVICRLFIIRYKAEHCHANTFSTSKVKFLYNITIPSNIYVIYTLLLLLLFARLPPH